MTALRFVPASSSPILRAAAEAATLHFQEVGLTVATAQGFRANLADAGLAARKTARPGVLAIGFARR